MKEYTDIQKIFEEKGVSQEDQEMMKYFLSSFSFQKRQQLMGILLGFPELVSDFVLIVKKKMSIAKGDSSVNPEELLALEEGILTQLLGGLAQK